MIEGKLNIGKKLGLSLYKVNQLIDAGMPHITIGGRVLADIDLVNSWMVTRLACNSSSIVSETIEGLKYFGRV